MTDDFIPVGTREYYALLILLVFARGMDFLSTYVATPNMVLEANPIAKLMGWRIGAIVNLVICGGLSRWPLTAILVATTSLLVAARNFQSAWLMRAMGEEQFRFWFSERIAETPLPLYLSCLLGQTVLTSLIGVALLWFDGVPMAIGLGILTYGITVLFYTLLSLVRMRRIRR
jgi:hypothetical protein